MAYPDDAADASVARAMRAHRARLIERVATGDMTIEGLFAEQAADRRTATVKVVVLAEKVPGVGKVRARRAMASLSIPEDARFGEVDQATLRALWSTMAETATRPLRPSDPSTKDP